MNTLILVFRRTVGMEQPLLKLLYWLTFFPLRLVVYPWMLYWVTLEMKVGSGGSSGPAAMSSCGGGGDRKSMAKGSLHKQLRYICTYGSLSVVWKSCQHGRTAGTCRYAARKEYHIHY